MYRKPQTTNYSLTTELCQNMPWFAHMLQYNLKIFGEVQNSMQAVTINCESSLPCLKYSYIKSAGGQMLGCILYQTVDLLTCNMECGCGIQ